MSEESKRCIEDEQDDCDGHCAIMTICQPDKCVWEEDCLCNGCTANPNVKAEPLSCLAGHQP